MQYFPKVWKHALIAVIPKKQAKSLPSDYRPISLLSSIGKLAERTILKALNASLQEQKVIPNEQFGFRAKHSANHQAASLANKIQISLSKKYYPGAVFLDLNKAFDQVWHHGLLYKAQKAGLPGDLVALIKSYIVDRSFQVRVGASLSETKPVRAGVPQGSPLAPVLFNLYMTGCRKTHTDVETAFYADDTMHFTSVRYIDCIFNRLQTQLSATIKWLKFWRLRVNPEKTQAIIFHRKKSIHSLPLRIGKVIIPWRKNIKYLGINFDQRFSWVYHVNEAVKTGNKLSGLLYPLLCGNSALSIDTKCLLYKMLIRSVYLYGSNVYFPYISDYQAGRLQIVQNKILRRIANAPWFVKNVQIHRELGVPDVVHYMTQLLLNFQLEAAFSINPLIRALAGGFA